MLVGVEVVAGQAGGAEGGQLRGDLGPQLGAGGGRGGQGQPEPRHVVAEAAIGPDQRRDARRRQHRAAVRQGQVQPDGQPRRRGGPGPGLRARRAADHQARGGQDAVAMGLFDGGIDLGAPPEVIGRDDQPLQAAAFGCALAVFRSRRKWKNSTPSRSRRTSICRSRIISPQMEAIFGARK